MTKIKAYSNYFVSFLLNELDNVSNINQIILFGSVAKEEATKNSDVDIFIDLKRKDKNFDGIIKKIEDRFYKSREALLFKNKGIYNKINVIIGKLEEWKDLKDSIESHGIVLYGPYIPEKIGGRKHVIVLWSKIGENRGAFLNKIYGVKIRDKIYKGLVELLGGRKLGKSSVMIPAENKKDFLDLMKKYKVDYKILEVYST